MKFIFKILILIGILVIGIIGVLWIVELLNQEQAINYSKKALAITFLLSLIGMASRLVLGKNQHSEEENDNHQGPKF